MESLQVGGGEVALQLIAVFLLVFANGFFVAAEFGLVASRRSRIDHMAAEGDAAAKVVQKALTHLDRYISGTQLGITMSSLGLGWIGEPAMAKLFAWVLGLFGYVVNPTDLHGGAMFITAFFIVTFLHVVLGELAPKSIALTMPEKVAKVVTAPLVLFSRLMMPFIYVFNGAGNMILKLFGVVPVSELHSIHSPEELRLLVIQSHAHGVLDESDRAMLAGVFDFHNKKAVDVMRPRTEVVALDITATTEEVWEILRAERYSRYPVYRETLDDVVGVFLARDLWLHPPGEQFSLEGAVREALYIPDSRPAERVLDDLRRTRAHMAVVLDEYGGTSGIVTMEDLIEEVIGDISDEYDLAARDSFEENGVLELAGSMSLIDVRSDHKLDVPEGDYSTLGGYAFATLGRLPRVGDRVPSPGGELEIVAMDGRRVAGLRVHRSPASGHESSAKLL
ncbi:MAG: hemolysin family protein [Gemmatimonadaceae bacterium]